MRRLALAIFGLLALLLSSCGSQVEGSPQQESTTGFNLVFKYGVGAKNVLDTAQGTFRKDMIVDPSITVKLRLSQDELDRIIAKMDEIDFWSYPKVLEYETPANGMGIIVTPYSSYYFKAQRGTIANELTWEDEHADQSSRATGLRELTMVIREIIESKPEYKALPQPRGGYI